MLTPRNSQMDQQKSIFLTAKGRLIVAFLYQKIIKRQILGHNFGAPPPPTLRKPSQMAQKNTFLNG